MLADLEARSEPLDDDEEDELLEGSGADSNRVLKDPNEVSADSKEAHQSDAHVNKTS